MSSSWLVFNRLHSAADGSHSQLLHLISLHPSFRSTVNRYYLTLNSNPTPAALNHLASLYLAFLLPDFPPKTTHALALQMVESIRTLPSATTSNNLLELLLRMCALAIENIDVRTAIGFLQLLESRVTDTWVVDAADPRKKRKIATECGVQLLDVEMVLNDSGLAEKHHRQEMKHVYFEERVVLNEQELNQVEAGEVVVRELKPNREQVLPWGFFCEDYIFQYTNNNFETKNSYRLRKGKRTSFDKVAYWCNAHEATNNTLRDMTVNQEIFLTCGALTQHHLPSQTHPPTNKPLPLVRINQTFARKNYLQRLRENASNTEKFFNILSEYYDRDQFDIDELTLTREKLIVRRKEHLLGISGKETIKKEVKDYEQEVAELGLCISRYLNKFMEPALVEANIKELTANLKQIQSEDSNINHFIQKNLSAQERLPRDPEQPFLADVVSMAQKAPLQLLIIGRPKSGKTTLAKAVAKKYSLVYISVESMVEKVFERVKFFQQNPPEVDDDGNPKDGLLPIEKYILNELQQGRAVDQEDVLELINGELEKDHTLSRGFILDLPFEYNKYWIDTLTSNRIYLPKIGSRFFTHILQTQQSEEQWKHFMSGLMQKPEDQSVSSALDRYLLVKPKPPPEEGEEDEAADPGDEEKPQPLVESNLLQVKWKDHAFSLIEHLSQHIHPHRHIKLQNSFMSTQECLALLAHSLYPIPLPKKLEGSEKELLGVGLDELKVFRKWSPWGLIDCVELERGKLIAGKFEFAAEYAGRVFVFENENNQNSFLSLPRKYLQRLPELPRATNICISGPRKSGKKTIANMLGEIYGLPVLNIQEILESIIVRQKQFESHVPSNFDKRVNSIHLSQGEWKDFYKGGLLNAKDVLPMILHQIGVNLQKKPAGWGIERNQDGETPPEVEERKPVPKKTKKKDKNAEEQRPKTPPPEDLSLKDVIPEINFMGKLDEIKGYIIIGYPNNEQQLNALKQYNIPIDKLIILSDNTEENPNRILSTRLTDAQIEHVGTYNTNIGPVKEALGEEVCKELFIDKTPEEIVVKIRQIIDPFYLKADDDATNRVCADKQEEGDPIPMGFCGEYCPVALQQGWLIKGKEEFEAGIQGRRFRFSGEKELNDFKTDPSKYLQNTSPAVPPRIMFMGIRGVGLRTQLLKLNEKYRIPILALKDTLLQQLENEKNKRKTERYYGKGFKKPQFDEDGKQVEDAELLEQAGDFDKKANEIEVLKGMFGGINEIFINGNFYDVEEDRVSTSIVELLGEARRLPEVVVMLTSEEQKWLERVLDRKAIERELEEIKEKRRIEKEKEKEEARQKAIQAGEEYNEPAEEEQDPEIPKLQQMIAQKQQSLKAQRQADLGKIQEYTQAFKGLGVQVINIKCEREAKHVTDRINYLIKQCMDDRATRWERNSMLPIDRFRVNDFLNHHIAEESRFGKLNPFSLMEVPRPYPLIYRERIYYLRDEEEREHVMRNPRILEQNQPVPSDVRSVPVVFIMGRTKSGKTTLAHNLRDKYGFKVINLQEIIEEFVIEHEDSDIRGIVNDLKNGKVLTDEALVSLIEKRTTLADCSRGWILDGLPANKRQCELLNRRGIVPTAVIYLRMSELQVKKRVLAKQKQNKDEYNWDMEVIHSRLGSSRDCLVDVQTYYVNKYNNVKTVDAGLSKWGVLEQSRSQIERRVKAKRVFLKDLVCRGASDVSQVGLSYNCILHNLSEYGNFCPISYKIRREYVKLCLKNYEHIGLYNRKIYVFKTSKELKDFIANPDTFLSRGQSFSPPQELGVQDISKNEGKFENQGYGMIELLKKNLKRGNTMFGLTYKNKFFLTSTAKGLKTFQKNPALYEMVKLPDKLPVEFEKKSDLKKIAKRNDCSAFLEHHLSNIMMRSLAQLGYRRPKYPTLGSKESALKFLSISLKANNPNKDDDYRMKYKEKLNRFMKECNYTQEIREELGRRGKGQWEAADEENLTKLCEEYSAFLKELEATEKTAYFSEFIR